jgi:hypothetical protein
MPQRVMVRTLFHWRKVPGKGLRERVCLMNDR